MWSLWMDSLTVCIFVQEETGRDEERLCETTSTSGGGIFAPLMLLDVSGAHRTAGTTTANYVHSTCSIGISGCIVVWSLCRGQESYSNNDEDQV